MKIIKTILNISVLIFVFPKSILAGSWIRPEGPKFKEYSVTCIDQIEKTQFQPELINQYNQKLILDLNIVITKNLQTPAFEIQELIIKNFHRNAKFPIQLIADSKFHRFKSTKKCINCPTVSGQRKKFFRNFAPNYIADITVFIVESVENFRNKLKDIEKLHVYNPRALFFVYFARDVKKYQRAAWEILSTMNNATILKAAVLIPRSLQVFEIFTLKNKAKWPEKCGSNVTMVLKDRCQNGILQDETSFYKSSDRLRRDKQNCSISVLAMPFPPFVINEHDGLEVRIIQLIGKYYNINFEVQLLNETDDLDAIEDGVWVGPLGVLIQENYPLAIGFISPEKKLMKDFEFTDCHTLGNLIWAVPIAQLVPKWRVLVAVFNLHVWAVVISSFIVFGTIFVLSSKWSKSEHTIFKRFKHAYLISYSVLINQATIRPITDFTRAFFLSYTIFSMIIYTVYTVALLDYLQNPVREHQMHTLEEIVHSNLSIGGLHDYREVFNITTKKDGFTEDELSKEVFSRYINDDGNLDHESKEYWLKQVGLHRNTCTILGKLVLSYLISQNANGTVDEDGHPIIYLVKDNPITMIPLSIAMKKGHPYYEQFNFIVSLLMQTGIVQKMVSRYLEAVQRRENIYDEAHHESGPESLTFVHLQGAFACFAFGNLFGIVALVFEGMVSSFLKWKTQRKTRKVKRK